ncbi:hypothetical protein IJD44_03655 [bacterium]|nr:hypothetical protein [bacterium]
MTISIRKAFDNITSDKYDKKNILCCFVLLLISFLCEAFMNALKPGNPKTVSTELSTILFYLFLIPIIINFLISGIFLVATNNAIHKKLGVFPNPVLKISKIVFTSFKYIAGGILTFIVLMLPLLFVSIPICLFPNNVVIMVIFSILGFAYMIFSAVMGFGLYFNFIQNLKFKSLFQYTKALQFIKNAGSSGGTWLLKSIVLRILSILLLGFALIVIGILTGAVVSKEVIGSNAFVVIMTFIIVLIYCPMAVCQVDITGQFFAELRAKKILPPLRKKQKEVEQVKTEEVTE